MMKIQKLIKDFGWDYAINYMKTELNIIVKEYEHFGVK